VHEVFAPTERICASCGAKSRTARRECAACGAPYVARRVKRLSTRRARVTLAAGIVVLAAVIGGGIALLTPGVNRGKAEQAAAARRTNAAAMAAVLRREAAEQRLHLATGRTRVAGAGAPPALRLRQRASLVTELEQAIGADARVRVRAGSLTGPVLYTRCSAYPTGDVAPETVLSARIGAYQCLVVNVPVKNQTGTVGVLGDPFWARIDFAASALAWCKINPRAGERAVGANVPSAPLAPVCDLEAAPPAGF
jgi:hypothetical protein